MRKTARLMQRSGAAGIGLWLLLAPAALACPGCKQPEGQPLNGTSLGFGWGVLFMLVMMIGTSGFLGRMMYRSCQALAAQHAALAERHALDDAAGETA